MSSEQIVNRTANTPALQAELEEAGLADPKDIPGPEENIDGPISSDCQEPDPAFQFGRLDPDNFANFSAGPVDWSGAEGHISTAEALSIVINGHLEFKGKVIIAFKHLGLDTAKFFGE